MNFLAFALIVSVYWSHSFIHSFRQYSFVALDIFIHQYFITCICLWNTIFLQQLWNCTMFVKWQQLIWNTQLNYVVDKAQPWGIPTSNKKKQGAGPLQPLCHIFSFIIKHKFWIGNINFHFHQLFSFLLNLWDLSWVFICLMLPDTLLWYVVVMNHYCLSWSERVDKKSFQTKVW